MLYGYNVCVCVFYCFLPFWHPLDKDGGKTKGKLQSIFIIINSSITVRFGRQRAVELATIRQNKHYEHTSNVTKIDDQLFSYILVLLQCMYTVYYEHVYVCVVCDQNIY
jgi:hypothetical protein